MNDGASGEGVSGGTDAARDAGGWLGELPVALVATDRKSVV